MKINRFAKESNRIRKSPFNLQNKTKRKVTMNVSKYFKSKSYGRRLFFFLMALLLASGLVLTQAPNSVLGLRRDDPTETDPIGVGDDPPQFSAPAGGFNWSMEKRFGLDRDRDGLIDYHWTPDGYVDGTYVHGHYDPAYIYPTSWTVTFDGCQTENDHSSFTKPEFYDYAYQWKLDNTILTTVNCKLTRPFTDKSSHSMGLTVTNLSDGSSHTFPDQMVQIKDYFIVSIGDSYASGQGNPDVEMVVDPGPFAFGWNMVSPARWQDERCHRSANAAPALAALALEASDPHSSVTFISFACTGATIQTPSYDPVNQDGQLFWGLRGSGILGPQRGEITDVEWGDYEHYIKPQMQQLEEALAASNGQNPRQIDALLISGGGNDMKFAPIMMECIAWTNCWVNVAAAMQENPITDTEWYILTDIVTRAVGQWQGANPPLYTLPGNYADLGARINQLNPKPAHVYVTQYPDPTINDRGVSNEANETYQHHCRMLDDIAWPNPVNVMTDVEAQIASHFAQTKLNEAIRISVENLASTYPEIDWQFVDGISIFDVDPNPAVAGKPGLFVGGPDGGPGHGYCASNNWIRRADESELIQGPVNVRALSAGTMHPNYTGHQVIKSRILRYMIPDLAVQSPQEAPTFSFSYSSGGLTSQPGQNGWYIQSCDSGNVCYPKVVGQAVAQSNIVINGASISLDNEFGCTGGVACTINPSSDGKQVTYKVEISASGTYRFQFNAQDSRGQAVFLQQEIKVDLEDPFLATPIGPFEVAEGDSVVVSASIATDSQGVPLNDDVLVDFNWDLDNDGVFETTDEQPIFSAADINGPATLPIQVEVTDRAGRTATAQADVNITNVAPVVVINGAPATGLEGTTIDLTSSITNAGVLDTFTYAWAVKKDGTSYATGSATNFSFTPDDNGAYEVSLTVTDNDGREGIASQTIDVLNVAPTPAILDVPTSPKEGSVISLSSSVTDPGADTISGYAWSVKKNGNAYAAGSAASFSFTPDDNDAYEVSLSVTDDDGGVGTTSQTINVANVAPALNSVGVTPTMIDEGGSVTLSGSISDASSMDAFHMDVDWGDGSPLDNVYLAPGSTSFSLSHTYADDNPTDTASDTYNIGLTIYDDDGGTGTGSTSVVVNNLAPSLTITAPESGALYPLNTSVSLSAALTDASASDTLVCSVDWGDRVTENGTLSAGVCTGSHAYTAAGVYAIQMRGTDDDTGVTTKNVMVVVYDPSAGFVTGGGWINSPAGAYRADGSLIGKATFGFVSKYQKGATVPTGNTAFEFDLAGMTFSSTSYEWLVVNQTGTNAQFKGTGTVNGAADPNGNPYKFMLWASDDANTNSADTFRIRIWWEDSNGEHVVYDNGIAQAIGAGNIVVHTRK